MKLLHGFRGRGTCLPRAQYCLFLQALQFSAVYYGVFFTSFLCPGLAGLLIRRLKPVCFVSCVHHLQPNLSSRPTVLYAFGDVLISSKPPLACRSQPAKVFVITTLACSCSFSCFRGILEKRAKSSLIWPVGAMRAKEQDQQEEISSMSKREEKAARRERAIQSYLLGCRDGTNIKGDLAALQELFVLQAQQKWADQDIRRLCHIQL